MSIPPTGMQGQTHLCPLRFHSGVYNCFTRNSFHKKAHQAVIIKNGAPQLQISNSKYCVKLMIQIILTVILVPKQDFECTLQLFLLINVLKDFLEVVECMPSVRGRITVMKHIITPFHRCVSCSSPSFLSPCSCQRSMCSSCRIATGTDYRVVMQADMEAPHLNAKNRTCVFVFRQNSNLTEQITV